jgi:hypothetical protein
MESQFANPSPSMTIDDSEVDVHQLEVPQNKFFLLKAEVAIYDDTKTHMCAGIIKGAFIRAEDDILYVPSSDSAIDGNFGDSSPEQQPVVRFRVDNENSLVIFSTKGLASTNLTHQVQVTITTDSFN